MNRNEFYKQLMSEYSFNDELIKSNARKGRFAKQRNLPLFVGITAAAAVLTVAVGTSLALNLGGNHGVDLIQESDGLAALSANERLQKALEEIERNADSTERYDVLVTFSLPCGAQEAKSLLSGYAESIPVKQLYFSDGTKAIGSEQVGKAFGEAKMITGAVINCEGAMMKSLLSDSRIFSVEIVTESDLANNVAPIIAEETAEVTLPENNSFTPTVPVIPADNLPSTEVSDTSSGSGENGEVIGDVTIEESVESWETTEESLESEENFVTEEAPETEETAEAPAPTQPAEVVPAAPAVPEITAGTLPEGVVLPTELSRFSYKSEIKSGTETAFFLTDNIFFAKSADEISLTEFDGSSERVICSVSCSDAKIVWAAESGGKLIVSGVGENGMRNKLFFVNAYEEAIYDLAAEDTVMDGTLSGTGYCEESKLLVMNIKENRRYYVCTATVTSSGMVNYLATCYESDGKTALLGISGNNVYLAVSDGGMTNIVRTDAINGGSETIRTIEGNPSFSRNLASTAAIFSSDKGTEIFFAPNESFTAVSFAADGIYFGASKNIFSADGGYYGINGGETLLVSDIAKVEYRRSFSQLYISYASDGVVKIIESPYNAKMKTTNTAYDVSESCSAELRTAAERAIGLHNALALGRCSDSGITDLDLLNATIKSLYTSGAAAKLKEICDISDLGALRYNGTSLAAINAADARLVISSQTESAAQGTLYVKGGTIGGRTAYYPISVSFAVENGAWKLDCVIA